MCEFNYVKERIVFFDLFIEWIDKFICFVYLYFKYVFI